MDFFMRNIGLSVALMFWAVEIFAGEIPDYYSEPGFKNFRQYQIGDHAEAIDPFSGGLNLIYRDAVIPGNNALDLVVTRSYRSLQGQPGVLGTDYKQWASAFGLGWDIHMGRIWKGVDGCQRSGDSANQTQVLELSDGSRRAFYNAPSGSGYDLITQDRWVAKCLNAGNDGFIVYSPEGLIYYFDRPNHPIGPGSGYAFSVTKIVDANGNQINIEYRTETNYELVSKIYLLEGGGIEFFYKSYDNSSTHQDYLILDYFRFTNDSSRKWTFEFKPVLSGEVVHAGYYYLTKVDLPTGGSANDWEYTYFEETGTTPVGAGLYSLKSTESPGGTTTSYDYQFAQFNSTFSLLTTVIKTKSIQGGSIDASGTWHYEFNPHSAANGNDQTIITDPLGHNIEYEHFGAQRANTNGTVWRIGSVESVRHRNSDTSSPVQTETYEWNSDFISDQNLKHSRLTGVEDANIYTPQLIKKTMTRDGSDYITEYANFEYGFAKTVTESGNDARTTHLQYEHKIDLSQDLWILGLVTEEKIDNAGTANGVSQDAVIGRSYDAKGNLKTETRYGLTHDYSRCSHGEVNLYTDPANKKTSYTCTLYKHGVPQEEIQGYGGTEPITITRSVNQSGTIASKTLDGKTTIYQWDDLNRLTDITTPRKGDSNIFIRWSSNHTQQSLLRGGFVQVRLFDGLERLIKFSVNGLAEKYEYDALGRKTFQSNLGDLTVGTNYQYDVLNRITRIDPPGSGAIDMDYLSGNRIKITDQRGFVTIYTYRSYGDPQETVLTKIEAPNRVTEIARNRLGNIEKVVQDGLTRSYRYNGHFQLISITHPEIGTEHLGRDDVGNLISRQIGSGPVTQYQYDDHHRLKLVNYADANTPDLSYTYTPSGLLETLTTDNHSTWRYRYNDNDQLIEETLTLYGAAPAKTFKMKYYLDKLDNPDRMVYPSGLSYEVATNALGRMTKLGLTGGQELIANAEYWPNGALKRVEYANGRTTEFGQNSQLKTTYARTLDTGTLTDKVFDQTYDYDGVGNMIALIDQINGLYSFTSLGYDGLNRLTQANGQTVLTYDSSDNITTNKLGGRDLTYHYINNQLSSVTGASYNFSYDARGNVINNGVNSFVYDEANNLREVSGQNQYFYYDGHQQRVWQQKSGHHYFSVYGRSGLLLHETNDQEQKKRDFIYIDRQLVSKVEK